MGFLGEARQHQAQLIVRRPGNARPLQFVLDPELVDSPSVDRAFMLRPGVGYVRVNGFDPQTARQLKDAIEKLGGAKLQGLVIDLRDNPGGVVESALEVGCLFPEAGPKNSQRERAKSSRIRTSTYPRPPRRIRFSWPCW